MHKQVAFGRRLIQHQGRYFARFPYEKPHASLPSRLSDPSADKTQEEIFEMNASLAEYNLHEIEMDCTEGRYYMSLHRLDLLREKIATQGEPVDAVYINIMLDRLKIAHKLREVQTFFVEAGNLETFLNNHPSLPAVLLNNANMGMYFDCSISMAVLKRFADKFLSRASVDVVNIYFNLLAVR